MKKSFLAFAMFIGVAATAQELTSKKGLPILPEAGDWGLGVSANSMLNYAGKMLTSTNAAPSFNFVDGTNAIMGKYFKDANTAYRVGLRIGIGSDKTTTGDKTDKALSETKISTNNINLMAGIQKYRGKGRVRGFYGGEAGIGLGGKKTTNVYNGNAVAGTLLVDKEGSTFDLKIRGFIGAEFFFAPKVSLSGEMGWGIGLSSTGAGSKERAKDGTGATETTETGKSSSFGLDTDNATGLINLNFYF